MTPFCDAGFPHSDTHGSEQVDSSPWLFAVFHVLRRFLTPKHPPYTLNNLNLGSFPNITAKLQ